MEGGTFTGRNNIIYFNSADFDPQWSIQQGGGEITLSYTCVSQALAGIGNITDDPLFVDSHNDDFHLLPGSPCIDTGDPASPLDPDGTRADMGALSFDQGGPHIELSADSLLFDNTILGEADSLSFTIYNFGGEDLIIWDMMNDLPDIFSFDWSSGDSLIIPGDSMMVEVVFTPADTLLYSDTLDIENNNIPVSVYLQGMGIPMLGVNDTKGGMPSEFVLYPAFPNPFNPSTVLSFELRNAGMVKMVVYNVRGRK